MKILKVLALFLIIFTVFSCSEPPENKLIIAVRGNSFNHFSVYMAYELKFLERENFLLKYYDTGLDAYNAVKKHKADIAITDVSYALTNNDDLENIMPITRQGYGLAANWEYKTLKQLKNKTIGVLKGSIGHIIWLLFDDLNNTSIKVKTYSKFSSMFKDYTHGKISGFVDNAASLLKKRHSSKAIKWFNNSYPHHVSTVAVLNKKIKKSKKELINKFKKALEVSQSKLADPNFSMYAAIQIYKLNEQICKGTIDNTYFINNKLSIDNNFFKLCNKKMLALDLIKNQNVFKNFYY